MKMDEIEMLKEGLEAEEVQWDVFWLNQTIFIL